MNDLLIKAYNDIFRNGYDYYHVRMGQGFIDALEASLQLKDPIENESRKEHGTRTLVSLKKSKRVITLKFNIHGATRAEFMENKKRFENILYNGLVDIIVNDPDHYYLSYGHYTDGVYHLIYTGKSVTYHHSYNGKFGVWTGQFIEPNPANRSEIANQYVDVIT